MSRTTQTSIKTIGDLKLSARTANALTNYLGPRYADTMSWTSWVDQSNKVMALPIEALTVINFQQLLLAKNFGKRCLAEVCDALTQNGLQSQNCSHCHDRTVKKRERAMVPGEIFRSPNGNLYLVLPNLDQAFLGNTDFKRTDCAGFEKPRLNSSVVHDVVAKVSKRIWKGRS